MSLNSRNLPKNLLLKHSLLPLKRLGQYFLVDKNAIEKIIKAADLKTKDVVLEVGPGTGELTKELSKWAKKLIAVEKDERMVETLKELLNYLNIKNVKIINGDILKVNPEALALPKNYRIVANLPYYLTSFFIRKFLESEKPPTEMTLVVQKEIAQRIVSQPPRMNLLAVSVQIYSKPKIVGYISRGSFWPQPKVDSAIIRIKINKKQLTKSRDLFFKIVRAGFSHPRKQILNNLIKGLALSMPKGLKLNKELIKSWLQKNRIKPEQRAETLSLQDWISLTKNFITK